MIMYVNFPGSCAEAFRFYETTLGGAIGMLMTHGETAEQFGAGAERKDAVLHARIALGGTELSGADIPSAQPMQSASSQRFRLAARSLCPIQETFFATRFAQLEDRFGINWMIVRERATLQNN